MNEGIMTQILEKIKAYPRIMLFGHMRPDGDCVGATKGFQAVLKASFPEKEILRPGEAHSDYLSFLGPDEPPVPDETYASALALVLDTGGVRRIADQKFSLCKEIVKIDHHIELEPYGALSWVEPDRSSACEMVTAFCLAFPDELTITPEAALYLYTGMVTDSGRFRFEGVSGDTLRCAAALLDRGIDTQTLFAHLYLKDFESFRFQSYVFEHMRRTENGVAAIYVSQDLQRQFGLSLEEASACVSYMDSIKGCLCWLAFIENGDESGSIRVRVRSRFLPTNCLAERHHGGGHACASGATVYSEDEMNVLIDEADALVRDFKATHTDWL